MNPKGSPDIAERGKSTRFKRGGSAAVEAQKKSVKRFKENRSMRQTMKILANTALGAGRAFDIEKIGSLEELNEGKNLTVCDAVALSIVQGALEDDVECRRLFLELSGAMMEESAGAGIGDAEDDALSASLRELAEGMKSDDKP